jgi:hypothetical protein
MNPRNPWQLIPYNGKIHGVIIKTPNQRFIHSKITNTFSAKDILKLILYEIAVNFINLLITDSNQKWA